MKRENIEIRRERETKIPCLFFPENLGDPTLYLPFIP